MGHQSRDSSRGAGAAGRWHRFRMGMGMKTPAHTLPTPAQVAMLRARLLAAQRRVVGQIGSVEEGLRGMAEARDSELEEQSQALSEADLSTRLGEEEFANFSRIEGTLHRITAGTYGLCTHCSAPIPIGRLRADPAAALCAPCARTSEAGSRPAAAPETAPGMAPEQGATKSPVPPDLLALEDSEIVALVHECFREQVGEALEDLRVVCRHSVVTLAGDVASEELRQVALRIVEDEMGLDTTDRMRVTGVAGEAEERSAAAQGRPTNIDEFGVDITGGDGISEDIFEVEEDGIAYTPPARPVADSD